MLNIVKFHYCNWSKNLMYSLFLLMRLTSCLSVFDGFVKFFAESIFSNSFFPQFVVVLVPLLLSIKFCCILYDHDAGLVDLFSLLHTIIPLLF